MTTSILETNLKKAIQRIEVLEAVIAKLKDALNPEPQVAAKKKPVKRSRGRGAFPAPGV